MFGEALLGILMFACCPKLAKNGNSFIKSDLCWLIASCATGNNYTQLLSTKYRTLRSRTITSDNHRTLSEVLETKRVSVGNHQNLKVKTHHFG